MSSVVIPAKPGAGGNGPGRPRHTGRGGPANPRQEILSAAAQLFVDQGFAATSTREIADAVGIRQASLYYHFAGKDEIIAELLRMTVRPTIDQIEKIEDLAAEHGWAAALYALVMVDTDTLAKVPHNIGRLASFPDVRILDVFEPYKAIHDDLVATYERFGRKIAGLNMNGILLTHLAEVIITFRSNNEKVDLRARHAVAAVVLRACGAAQEEITLASAVAWEHLIEE